MPELRALIQELGNRPTAGRTWVRRFACLHAVSLPLQVPTLLGLAGLAVVLGVEADAWGLMLLLIVFIVVTPSHHGLVERVLPQRLPKEASP